MRVLTKCKDGANNNSSGYTGSETVADIRVYQLAYMLTAVWKYA